MNKEVLLIVGLGNPGEKYAHTRHNAGFEVLDRLAEHYGVKMRRRILLQGQVAEITDGEKKIVLCEPLTFMNKSGECVKRLLNRYKVPQEQMLVIYDDIDLPPGKVRVRKNGGPGTHNGMRSIEGAIGKTEFPRIRVGTGDRPKGEDLAAWVLGHPSAEERPVMEEAFERAKETVKVWIAQGIDKAMQSGNKN
jgi:PTH1 family peptidyl-tRNA hydrolase